MFTDQDLNYLGTTSNDFPIEKNKITKTRLITQKKRTSVRDEFGKLDEAPIINLYEDFRMKVIGHLANVALKQSVATQLMEKAIERDYKDQFTEDQWVDCKAYLSDVTSKFTEEFAGFRKELEKKMKKTEIWRRMGAIKGISPYRLAIICGMVGDVGRFDTCGKFLMYTGCAVVNNMAMTKANMNKIKDYMHDEHGRDMKGFQTAMGGQLYNLEESFLRSKGYFYKYYLRTRKRLEEKAMNEGARRNTRRQTLYEGQKKSELDYVVTPGR